MPKPAPRSAKIIFAPSTLKTIKEILPQQAVLLAPMEDVTDIPFRLVCKRLGADVVYTEFVNSEGLVRHSSKTIRKMSFEEEERPFGIQLYGGVEESMQGAARMAAELQPDLIDINCGCWVKNVVGQGAGAGLLNDLPRMRRIVAAVVDNVQVPVTVKTRLGWDAKSINILDTAKVIEQTGAQALTIHCRTRAQGHSGDPDYSWIPKVKEVVGIPIIVNGGITTPQDAKKIFDETGCDGVMLARAAMNDPWIFRSIKRYLADGTLLPPPSPEERLAVMFGHLAESVRIKGERYGVMEFRKYISGYLRNLPGVSKLRAELVVLNSEQELIHRVNTYMANLRISEPQLAA